MNCTLIFAMAAAVVASFVNAVPIKKRSSGGATIEFHMSNSDYNSFPWTSQNSTLAQVSTDSKDAYPGSGIQCPETVQEGADVPLHLRSTCPWYYEAEHVSTRYPTTILNAYAACQHCIGRPDLQCQAIKRMVTILEKKTLNQGDVEFVESEIEINVGFTCAGDRTAQSGSDNGAAEDLPDFA